MFDVDGSGEDRLWEREKQQMQAEIERLRELLGEALVRENNLIAALRPFADLADKLEGRDNLIGLISPDDFLNAKRALKD